MKALTQTKTQIAQTVRAHEKTLGFICFLAAAICGYLFTHQTLLFGA
jgi:hypothetical protein